ncbi:MAG: hypothetical protein ABJA02_11010 [Acidobacteriota bacterium]
MKTTRSIVAFVIGTKLALFVFGTAAFLWLLNENPPNYQPYFGIWNRWDAPAYIGIAQHGYAAVGDRHWDIVFFPLYPLLVSLFSLPTGDYVQGGVLVSAVASVFLALYFHRLIKLDYPHWVADRAIWFLFIFPTAYFLHIPYTESLFLALVVGTFYSVRKERWLLAGILGAAACATRVNGLILCAALPFELWTAWKREQRIKASWAWLGLIPLGFVAYLGINYFIFGDPFEFLTIQREHWQKYLANPITGVLGKFHAVLTDTRPAPRMEILFEAVFIAIGFLGTALGWKHLRGSYRVWMVLSWLLFVSTSFILSVPRYTLTMFPLFIVMAVSLRKPVRFAVASVISILFLALFTAQFAMGRWAF